MEDLFSSCLQKVSIVAQTNPSKCSELLQAKLVPIHRSLISLLQSAYKSYHNYLNKQKRLGKTKAQLKKNDVAVYHIIISFCHYIVTFPAFFCHLLLLRHLSS